MALADLVSAFAALQIDETALDRKPCVLDSADALVQSRVDHAEQVTVEVVRVPPTVHVGFAETERAEREDARIQTRVVNADVARCVAVDAHAGEIQQRFDARVGLCLRHRQPLASNEIGE